MTTIRLTAAQAMVRFLSAQRVEIDGRKQRLFEGVFAIFGHGNVAGMGEALFASRVRTCAPEIAQSRKRRGHAVDRLAIVDAAREPLDRRLGEDRPANRETLNDATIVRQREGLRQILFRRLKPEQQHAAA